MVTYDYTGDALVFLRRVIRHRSAIIGASCTDRNVMSCHNSIEHIKRHIEAGIFKSNRAMAQFILSNRISIRYLISDSADALIRKYDLIIDKSKIYKYL